MIAYTMIGCAITYAAAGAWACRVLRGPAWLWLPFLAGCLGAALGFLLGALPGTRTHDHGRIVALAGPL